jgi:hypothetical protein
MHALQLRMQGLVVLIEGIGLFCQRAFGVPVFEAQPVQVVEYTDAFFPLERPLLKLGKAASGIQEVAAHRHAQQKASRILSGSGQDTCKF